MRLEIKCYDRVGIAQQILEIFVEHNINVRGIELKQPDLIFINIPDLAFEELQIFMPQMRMLEGVIDVRTIAYMPFEREKNELSTIIQAFPDVLFSLDNKGNILLINEAALTIIRLPKSEIIGQQISHWLTGFNFTHWLDQDEVLAQTLRLTFQQENYIAEISPIYIESDEKQQVLAGAIVLLKSSLQLDKQVSVFQQKKPGEFANIQAKSGVMHKLIRESKRMAQLSSSMLISGETGTGKELLAKACHDASDRAGHPFMTLSCAALPDEDAESELFGHGSLTGGVAKRGLFELADGGTIFLDKVGEMSPKLQIKLLRVIQNGIFRRVDDEQEKKVNIRFISSTNKDLFHLVTSGEFREDLYYRLNVLGLNVPPLRERRSDIIPLAEHFIVKFCQETGQHGIMLSDDCRDLIEHYPWPGNVRQLENTLIRALSLIQDNEIRSTHLQLPAFSKADGYLDDEFEGTLDSAMKEFEASLLTKLYPAYPSTRQLGKKLGVSHTAIAKKLKDYNINKKLQ